MILYHVEINFIIIYHAQIHSSLAADARRHESEVTTDQLFISRCVMPSRLSKASFPGARYPPNDNHEHYIPPKLAWDLKSFSASMFAWQRVSSCALLACSHGRRASHGTKCIIALNRMGAISNCGPLESSVYDLVAEWVTMNLFGFHIPPS